MIKIIMKLFSISGKTKKDLKRAVLLQFIDSILASTPFGIIYLFIIKLLSNNVDLEVILKYTFIVLICIIARVYLNRKILDLQSGAGYAIMRDKRVEIGDHLKKMSMGYFNNDVSGDIISVVTSELNFIEMYCMNLLSKIIIGITMTGIIFTFLLFIDWRMAIISVATYPFAFVLYRKTIRSFERSSKNRDKAQGELTSAIIEFIHGIKEIKAFNSLSIIYTNLKDKIENQNKQFLKYEMNAAPIVAMFQCMVRVGSGLLLLCGSYFILNNNIEFYVFILFLIVSLKFYEPIEVLSVNYGIIKIMDVSLDKFQKLIQEKEISESEENNMPNSLDIAFENVHFSYDTQQVLKGINLYIPQNKITAIVGASGSGKTTLVSLIARFWDIDKGKISIGGIDITDMKSETLMSLVSIVFQDVYLFNDSVFNNIKIGNPNATDDDVFNAAQKANCHDFIMKMENGYETLVGEGGNTLSGGEKQRISIARAILKDSPIILLDEATASVDPENEKLIQQAINELVKCKTLVIIAHKLSHIKNADQIVVMDNGRIAERGKHEYLIEEEGLYFKYWNKRKTARNWMLTEK